MLIKGGQINGHQLQFFHTIEKFKLNIDLDLILPQMGKIVTLQLIYTVLN